MITIITVATRSLTSAQSSRYPIKELGNCRDARECHLYCQIPKNTPTCWSYDKYILHKNVLGEETNITFPIKELGNCTGPTECFNYCEKPENQATCFAFAKARGLAKDEEQPLPPNVMTAAKTELGCDNRESCQNLCTQSANLEKCRLFSEKHGLRRPPPKEGKMGPPAETMQAAQKELGCRDEASCDQVCRNPENGKKCFEFAKKYNLLKRDEIEKHEENEDRWAKLQEKKIKMVEAAQKELACDNFDSCKKTCDLPENREKCQDLAKKHGLGPVPPPSGQFPGQPPISPPGLTTREDKSVRGPGGCATDKECKEYCQKNPQDCPGFAGKSKDEKQKPTKQTPPKSGDFLGPKGCKTEKECEDYCKKHPDECPGFPKKPPQTPPPNISPPVQSQNYPPQTGQSGQPPNQPPYQPPNQPPPGLNTPPFTPPPMAQ